MKLKEKSFIILVGMIIGAISVALVYFGNPANMGFCIACFLRDTAGAFGLHRAEVVQYMRPEVIGLVLGAFAVSLAGKEFAPRGGSSPVTRFVLGFCVMTGALVFLGCPLRMMLRIGGGDLNAVVGLAGFAVGICVGVLFLKKGFSLNRTYSSGKVEGLIYPAISVISLILLCFFPFLLLFSEKGPGSMHAPILLSLAAGLIVGVLGQRARFCTVAGIRDMILFKESRMFLGFLAVIAVVAIGNLALGSFHLGFEDQPIAHSDGVWNFMGMLLAGFGSVLLGGCPFRQLILSGEGNGDSSITILGFIAGAAFCHNFKLASSADGPSAYGPAAVLLCLVVVTAIGIFNIKRSKQLG